MSRHDPAIRAALEQASSGRVDAAKASLQRALQRDPADPDLNQVMGIVLLQSGDRARAEYFLRRAAEASPRNAAIRNNLANALSASGRDALAEPEYRAALELDPRHALAHIGLTRTLVTLNRLGEAADLGRAAVALAPDRFEPHANYASALLEAGRIDECLATLRAALARFPDNLALLGALLPALAYSDTATRDEVLQAHRRYGQLLAARLPKEDPLLPGRSDPGRPLRLAFLSPDLRTHSIAYFLEPILEHHDASRFSITCYQTGPRTDATTLRLRSHVESWLDASSMDPDALLRRIRADRIDILIELSGHTIGNRLVVPARRAAPLQLTYLGYPNTTGIPAIDHRLIDSATDPAAPPLSADRYATERLIRLDPCFLCYRPADGAPDPEPRPADAPLTFGSFNALPKLSPRTIALWSRLLASLPNSRLLLKNRGLGDPPTRARLSSLFASHGIAADRLELLGETPSPADHLALYSRVDIALDPLPYNGTTTTCEALWMGVPVVNLAGESHASRVGASLLTAAGLSDLVATTEDAYLATARRLAADISRLAAARAGLRDQLENSPLLDAPAFTRRFESALRAAWLARNANTPP